jgi:hypothetical protein
VQLYAGGWHPCSVMYVDKHNFGYKNSLFYHRNCKILQNFLVFLFFSKKRPRFARILIQSLSWDKEKEIMHKKS